MKKSSFTEQKKAQINKAIEFAINEHLSVLNSDIVLPVKQGNVNDLRLLPTVTSRDTVYNNLMDFLDDPEIDASVKVKSQSKIVSGLKKTMDELIAKIILRPMKPYQAGGSKRNENSPMADEEEFEKSDDIISSVSNSVKKAKDLVILINNRIASIENPDSIKEKVDSLIIPSIAERYARNR
jgi:hypothetical protein